MRGLVRTAQLTAQFLVTSPAGVAKSSTGSSAKPCSTVVEADRALAQAVGVSHRACEEAQSAMTDSEAKLSQTYKVAEHRLQAKAMLLPTSKAIVRLTRAAAVLDAAVRSSQQAHARAERYELSAMTCGRHTLVSELKEMEHVLVPSPSLLTLTAHCSPSPLLLTLTLALTAHPHPYRSPSPAPLLLTLTLTAHPHPQTHPHPHPHTHPGNHIGAPQHHGSSGGLVSCAGVHMHTYVHAYVQAAQAASLAVQVRVHARIHTRMNTRRCTR